MRLGLTWNPKKLPYAPTSQHEAALESFKNRQAWRDYGKWESGSGDRAAYDAQESFSTNKTSFINTKGINLEQLVELKKFTSPTKSDYRLNTPDFKTQAPKFLPKYEPNSHQSQPNITRTSAQVSAPREFRQTSPQKVQQIRQRVDQLHTQAWLEKELLSNLCFSKSVARFLIMRSFWAARNEKLSQWWLKSNRSKNDWMNLKDWWTVCMRNKKD